MGQRVVWWDEMRLGLFGQVRRRWVPKGVKLRQKVEVRYVWRYLVLAVEPLSGRLWWRWVDRLKKESVLEVLQVFREEGVEVVVWDNAPSHRAGLVEHSGVVRVALPSYSPELNPVERIFEEVRRWVEGLVYGEIEKKMEAVECYLKELAPDRERVCRLAGWSWIVDALHSLPT